MGMKVPCGMDIEMSSEATLRGSGKIPGDSIPRTGESDTGRASMLRPCAYADRDTAEIFGGPNDRIYQKDESVIAIARGFVGKEKNFTGQNFWARGYYVSTVGREEATIRKYIQEEEEEDRRQDQLEKFRDE
jgi:hypothetical protein